MTVDNFLSIWSQHNTLIIEGLIAVVILLSLFLAYRGFFSKKDKDGGVESGLDAAQLEKTLQKILENQTHGAAGTKAGRAAHDELGMDVDLEAMEREPIAGQGGGEAGVSSVEVAQLRGSLSESQKKIEVLQAQLKDALKAAEAASVAPAAGEQVGGISAAEKEALVGKVKDLEARLAEYEIISEDIADLSRFRAENDQLRKELAALKGEAAPAPAPAPAPEVPVAELSVEDVSTPAAPADPVATGSSDLVDDELMKEFAAAVEGQKAALGNAATKAGDGSAEATKTGNETDQLMNEFENFVAKKN